MIFETFINYITIIAYLALNLDIIFQIFHISKRKSSKDLSLKGCFMRLFAVLIITIKLFMNGDLYLLIGHGTLTVVYVIYVFMLVYYRSGKNEY